MVRYQATTPSTSAIATAGMRRWRDSQNAQIANAANAAASPNRTAGHGRFEKRMASVVHVMTRIWTRNLIPVIGQRSNVDIRRPYQTSGFC